MKRILSGLFGRRPVSAGSRHRLDHKVNRREPVVSRPPAVPACTCGTCPPLDISHPFVLGEVHGWSRTQGELGPVAVVRTTLSLN